MKVFWIAAVFASAVVGTSARGATGDSDITGRWEVTTTYPGGSYTSGLDLSVHQDKVTGRSGWLAPTGPSSITRAHATIASFT
jgi:hypothetical protein